MVFALDPTCNDVFVCVEVLRPSQPNGVMSSAVSLPNHSFTRQLNMALVEYNMALVEYNMALVEYKVAMDVCLCSGFTAQSTQWGHVERGQFT